MINVIFQKLIQGCNDMKSTILLTIALFLAIAPSPDSKVLSEISGGFLAIAGYSGLMAAEPSLISTTRSNVSTQPAINSVEE